MPVHTNSIGTAEFFDLVGTIYLRQQQVEVIERPGVDGAGARLTGERGKPFQLISITYHESFADAADALVVYADMKTSLQEVVRNTVSLGTFLVLDVAEETPPIAVYNVAGASNAQCRAEVRWTLLG